MVLRGKSGNLMRKEYRILDLGQKAARVQNSWEETFTLNRN